MAMSQEDFDPKETIKSMQEEFNEEQSTEPIKGKTGNSKVGKTGGAKTSYNPKSTRSGKLFSGSFGKMNTTRMTGGGTVGMGDFDFDEDEQLADQYVTSMVVTPDGIEAPMFKRALTDTHAREFISEYKTYNASVDRHNARGDPRNAVALSAMVPVPTQRALRSRYFRGRPITDDDLLRALKSLAGMQNNPLVFDAER